MRFINSLAILSLAGLDLAYPVSSPQDASSLAGGTAVDTVTGALGLRDENHKRYAQRVRRQGNEDNEDVDSGDGIGAGIGASTLLRSRQLASDAAEGDGVLLRGRQNSLDLGQLQENPGVTDGGAADGAAADSDATDNVAPEAGDASLRARGDGKPHSGEHGGQGQGQGQGKGKGEGQSNSKSKGKCDGKDKENKDQSKAKPKPKDDHQGSGSGSGQGKGKGKGKCNDARHTPCLHSEDVDTLVDAYVRMLSKWNDADAKYLADDLVDTSDSINILAGIPLGSATFPTKQAFIDHQHTQVRPSFPFTITLPY